MNLPWFSGLLRNLSLLLPVRHHLDAKACREDADTQQDGEGKRGGGIDEEDRAGRYKHPGSLRGGAGSRRGRTSLVGSSPIAVYAACQLTALCESGSMKPVRRAP